MLAGRRQRVTLTDAGRARVEGSRQAMEEWLVQALREHCRQAERRTVADAMALLDRLTHA